MISSGNRLSDALVEGIESGFGVQEAVDAMVLANQDAAVQTAMDAVPGLEHGAPTGERCIVADKR